MWKSVSYTHLAYKRASGGGICDADLPGNRAGAEKISTADHDRKTKGDCIADDFCNGRW